MILHKQFIRFLIVLYCLISVFFPRFLFGQEIEDQWENYPIWENTTTYSKIYIVDQKHESANDTNSGAEDAPLLTIGAAIGLVKPGEKIIIKRGTYREIIQPVKGGTGPDKIVAIEAAEGEKVIIKGSYVIGNTWTKTIHAKSKAEQPSITHSRSQKLWITQLNDSLFEHGYNPFKNLLIPETRSRSPYFTGPKLYSGMIYQDGNRMAQLESYNDLIHISGSFWIDRDGKTIHIHPFSEINPNEAVFEVAVFPYLLKPVRTGLGYIQVKGLIFEHCANSLPSSGSGAVTILEGHHWIFENNTIREINATGLEISLGIGNLDSSEVKTDGYINLLNNRIYNCGTAGVFGTSNNAIIKNNEIFLCGWQEIESHEKSAGICLLTSSRCMLSNNIIHNFLGATGIWLQKNCNESRLSRNIIYNIASFHGALRVEEASKENLVDNNIIWNIDGIGINGQNSDNQLYYHNLIGNTTGSIVKIVSVKSTRSDSVKSGAIKNNIKNNIFYNFGDRMDLSSISNQVSNNIFVLSTDIGSIEIKKWQARLISKQGLLMRADAGFNPKTMMFKWNSKSEVQPVPSISIVKKDILNEKRTVPMTIPGPFRTLPSNSDYFVSLTVERQ